MLNCCWDRYCRQWQSSKGSLVGRFLRKSKWRIYPVLQICKKLLAQRAVSSLKSIVSVYLGLNIRTAEPKAALTYLCTALISLHFLWWADKTIVVWLLFIWLSLLSRDICYDYVNTLTHNNSHFKLVVEPLNLKNVASEKRRIWLKAVYFMRQADLSLWNHVDETNVSNSCCF